MNKILIDTNILIYAIDADSRFHRKSAEIITASNISLFTTAKNISEFLVVLTRADSLKIGTEEALDVLSNLLANMDVLYPNERSTEIFYKLLREYHPSGLRIHDFEIISIGLAHGISQIITQNISDFKAIKEIRATAVNEF